MTRSPVQLGAVSFHRVEVRCICWTLWLSKCMISTEKSTFYSLRLDLETRRVISDAGQDAVKMSLDLLRLLSSAVTSKRSATEEKKKRQTTKLSVFHTYVIKYNDTGTITRTCWAAAVAFCSACVSRRWSRLVFS